MPDIVKPVFSPYHCYILQTAWQHDGDAFKKRMKTFLGQVISDLCYKRPETGLPLPKMELRDHELLMVDIGLLIADCRQRHITSYDFLQKLEDLMREAGAI
jgi:hypothetical protein